METATRIPPASKKKIWAGRIISTLVVLFLLLGSVMALMHPAGVQAEFAKYGYPPRFLPILGAVELVCAILYAIPRTSVVGAILLTGYFGGATATHVRVGEPQWIVPVVFGVVIWLGLLLREDRLGALLPFRRGHAE